MEALQTDIHAIKHIPLRNLLTVWQGDRELFGLTTDLILRPVDHETLADWLFDMTTVLVRWHHLEAYLTRIESDGKRCAVTDQAQIAPAGETL